MDSRIRARRVAVLRAQGRRRLRVLSILVIFVAVCLGGWGVSRTYLLDIDKIVVTGLENTYIIDEADVISAAQLHIGLPMMDIDSEQSAEGVSALPSVKSVTVHRSWPATIKLDVDVRTPVATVPSSEDGAKAGALFVLDAHGYVIAHQQTISDEQTIADEQTISDEPTVADEQNIAHEPTVADEQNIKTLPHIALPFDGKLGDVHSDASPALSLIIALPEDVLKWVDYVLIDPEEGLGLRLTGGATAILGEPVVLNHKVASLRSVLGGINLECLLSINVTMANLSTVTRYPKCVQ